MKRPKFGTKKAIRVLLQSTDPDELYWELSRLLAWAFLDQKTGTRPRDAKNARHVGHIILSQRVHENCPDIEKGSINENVRQLLSAYKSFGGIKQGINTPTPRMLLQRFKKVEVETQFVFQVVDYLCRVEADGSLDKQKFTINFAKHFVEKMQKPAPGQKPYGLSKISKIWEKYAPSAQMIYATYVVMPMLGEIKSAKQMRLCLSNMSRDPSKVRSLIGYAAYAAAILAKTGARKVFTKSFKVANCEKPMLRQLSDEEKESIFRIDLQAPIP